MAWSSLRRNRVKSRLTSAPLATPSKVAALRLASRICPFSLRVK